MIRPTFDEFRRLAKRGNLIPVYKETLADLETPVSAFMKIDTGKYSFLLESVEGGEKIARHSFLGADPEIVFISKGHKVKILDREGENVWEAEDPFDELKRLLGRYKFVPVEGLTRFVGGFVGYIGYDMVRFFEKLPDMTEDDLKLPDMVFVFTDTILVFDHVAHKILVISNAYVEDENSLSEAYDAAVAKIEGLVEKLKSPLVLMEQGQRRISQVRMESNFTKGEFEEAVARAKEYIYAGDCVQVVLSQRFMTHFSAEPFDIYRALRSLNPSPFMYFLRYDDFQIVGSSPEVFVRLEDGKVELRPIAGTRRRGQNEKEDKELEEELLSDPKERAEHVMLVDLGRNDVGRVCKYHTVRVPEFMVIERYSHVMHIVSDVVGRIRDDCDQFDLVRACFPAGTVSGAPKVRAMEIIEELEPTKRGPYAGAIGYFSFSGNLDTCITIRTLILKDGIAYVQAGAGIVADSIPEREYEETVNKAKALVRAIEIAERGLE